MCLKHTTVQRCEGAVGVELRSTNQIYYYTLIIIVPVPHPTQCVKSVCFHSNFMVWHAWPLWTNSSQECQRFRNTC